jgi:hypothetical protein
MNRASTFAVVSILICIPAAANAGPACARWDSEMTPCEIYPNLPYPACLDDNNLSFSQRSAWKKKKWTKTASEACDNWKKYGYPNSNKPAGKTPIGSDKIRCSVDDNNNGIADDASQTVLERWDDVQEPCCKRTPQGPNSPLSPDGTYAQALNPDGSVYGVLYQPPFPGRQYSTLDVVFNGTTYPSQVKRVRAYNKSRFMGPAASDIWYSDLYYLGDPAMVALENPNCGGNLSTNTVWECTPQVHHMVPRVDENGCDCGANSGENALLISAKLNSEMSNDCRNPKMIAILDKWAPLPVAQIDAGDTNDARVAVAQIDLTGSIKQNGLLEGSELMCRMEDAPFLGL